jgi:hypothetical protein
MTENKLLIIEDNPEYQLFLKGLLQQVGDVENVNSLISEMQQCETQIREQLHL